MRVSRIRISNILGIQSLEIQPGAMTLVEGGNAQGKTSVVEAIRAVLGGGHDATLLRKGEKKGEVVLVVDETIPGGGQYTLTKTVTAGASKLEVHHSAYGPVSKPQTVIGKLLDQLSANPIDFLAAPSAKRAAWLLEAMPLTVTPEQLAAAGCDGDLAANGHALEVIARFRERLFGARTVANRELKQAQATIAQLGALEASPVEDPTARLAELAQEEKAIQTHVIAREKGIRADREAQIEELRKAHEATLDAVRNLHADTLSAMQQRAAEELRRVREEAAGLRAKQETFAQAQRAASIITSMEQTAAKAEAESERLTAAMENLDKLKHDLVSMLPIPGLEFDGGNLLFEGIPFERLNRAQQVCIAIKVGQIRAGNLGLVCIDGAECLDPETFQAFRAAALKSGLQFVVTRVSDGPLTVSDQGGARGAGVLEKGVLIKE